MLATLGSELVAQLGRRASAGGMMVASADTQRLSAGHVDFWSVHLELRPLAKLGLFAQGRGESRAFYLLAEGTERDTTMRFHGDAAATWTALPWLAVGATGGTTRDSGWSRSFAGPELRFQNVLPANGTAVIGYFKELGELPANTVYAQLGARPLARMSFWTRGSYSSSDDRDARNEAALSLAASGTLTTWLSVGATLMTTYGNLDGSGAQQLGLFGRFWASGRF
jgi:hypothetical protein